MIRKILVASLLFLMVGIPVLAEDVVSNADMEATQVAEVTDNKAAILFVKQPATDSPSQKVVVTKNWFSIILVANGKAVDTTSKAE